MILQGLVIAAGGWLVLIALIALCTRSRRPRPARASSALRGEPPAVVSALVGRPWRAGYPATLLDLAARGWFSMDEAGPGQVMCHVRAGQPAAGLTAYEEAVVTHLAARADPDGAVPSAALGSGFEQGDDEFRNSFCADVRADAVARGLIRRRISHGTLVLLAVAALPAAVLAVAALSHDGILVSLTLVAFGYLAVLLLPAVMRASYRLTPAGRAVLAEWLGFRSALTGGRPAPTAGTALLASGGDRRIGYAAALGAAPAAAGSFNADERRPWSSYGGSWHQVVIGKKAGERLVPGPIMIGYCVALCCVSVFMLVAIGGIGGPGWAIVFALVPGAIIWGSTARVFRNAARARQLPPVVEFDGQILKRWTEISTGAGEEDEAHPSWYMAVDDGEREQAWSLRISEEAYQHIRAGMIVHLRVDPRHNRLLQMTDVTQNRDAGSSSGP